jgi:hypothetical protein
VESSTERPILSAHLEALAAEIYRGNEPNSGRFCGNCYNPLAADASLCAHCGNSIREVPSVERIPREVLLMIKAKHGREARVVRSMAYGGLLLAMIAASAGLLFISGNWGIAAFILILIGGYFASAVLANSLGDAWGYRAGQRGLEEEWRRFVSSRDAVEVRVESAPSGHA